MKTNKLLPELYMTTKLPNKIVFFPKILSNFKTTIKTFDYLKKDKELNSSSKDIILHLKTLSNYGNGSKCSFFKKNNNQSTKKVDYHSKTLGKTSFKDFLKTKFFSSNQKNSKELSSSIFSQKENGEQKAHSNFFLKKEQIQSINVNRFQ